jgi:hypothetical protein
MAKEIRRSVIVTPQQDEILKKVAARGQRAIPFILRAAIDEYIKRHGLTKLLTSGSEQQAT